MIITRDFGRFTVGSFTVSSNPWGRGDLESGEDYVQSVKFNQNDLTSGVTFSWDWQENSGRVFAYNAIVVGYSPWDNYGTQDYVTQIRDLKTFDVGNEVEVTGNDALSNVNYEMWLTDAPAADYNHITAEVMVWTKAWPNACAWSGYDRVGVYTDGKFKADIYFDPDHGGSRGVYWDYIGVVSRDPHLKIELDMKDILDDLVSRGLVSDTDYMNGYEFGSEVCGGKGSLKITDIHHRIEAFGADEGANRLVGTHRLDEISGRGGDDTIIGQRGNDRLIGGQGSDTLSGGGGRDEFVFSMADDATDTIVDFQSGRDRIMLKDLAGDFDGEILWNSQLLKADRSGGGAAEGQLVYDRGSGHLYFDADIHSSADELDLIAIFQDRPKLVMSDIVL